MESHESHNLSQPHPQLYLVDIHHDVTWLEKLLLNLLSYSLVLVPIAVVVLSTRYRLCPSFLQSSALVQLFVNGSYSSSSSSSSFSNKQAATIHDSESLLIQDDVGAKRSTKRASSHHIEQQSDHSKDVLKFLWCFSGLMISYLVWGVLQEKIMTTKYKTDHISTATEFQKLNDESNVIDRDNRTLVNVDGTHTQFTFHDSQFLVFINRIIAFILAILALIYDRPNKQKSRSKLVYSANGKHQVIEYRNVNQYDNQRCGEPTTKPSAPLYQFVYCSLSNILSSWCQYEALKYVNFPTQVLSKTFKIVPVMIMSKILLHKKYKPVDYGCALALSLGMFIFLVNQPPTKLNNIPDNNNTTQVQAAIESARHHHQHEKQQDLQSGVDGGSAALLSGLLLLSLYLAFDSFTGNWQKSLFTRYQVTNWQMMAAVNLYSILLTLTSLYQLGNLTPALKMLAASRPLMFDCLMMSIMSSVGQFFVYYTINQFGPVIFTVIMTFRQFLAILISCLLYGHRLTAGSSLGILLVFMVVGFQLWHRSSSAGGGGGSKSQKVPPATSIRFASLANSSSSGR